MTQQIVNEGSVSNDGQLRLLGLNSLIQEQFVDFSRHYVFTYTPFPVPVPTREDEPQLRKNQWKPGKKG